MCILLVGYMTATFKKFHSTCKCLLDTDTVLCKTCSSYSTNECSLNLTGKM